MTRNQRDGNEATIVDALEKVGASVIRIDASAGAGMAGAPDLLVGYRGSNYLLEVKRFTGHHPRVALATLTPAQLEFFESWNGSASIVRTPTEALRAVGAINEVESVSLH